LANPWIWREEFPKQRRVCPFPENGILLTV
jgi:hypothetical protein